VTARRRGGWVQCLTLAGALIFSSAAVCADDIATFYSDKTLKIVVGLPPGGGADAYARLAQRHLPRHLAGAPSIVVQNVPGAGSLKSVVYLDAQPDDGTVLATFSSGLLTEALTSPERVKIDFRNYAWIGNVSEDVRVCYLWHAAGVRNWQDFAARKEVVFAASAAGTAGNVDIAVLRELLGIKVRQVDGYSGSADKRLAVEKGEVDGDCGGWTAMPQDWLRDGKVDVMVRLSPTLLPDMDAKIPFAGELLKSQRDRDIFDFLMAPEKLGRPFMTSGQAPAERVAALRQAFGAMVADPAFRGEAAKLRLTVTPMSGEDVARDIAALYAAPPDLLARAKAMVGE
jgi:tripartite-type tricarboxylate transporter receptor subunit TctC